MKKLDAAACIDEPTNGQARTIEKLEVSIDRIAFGGAGGGCGSSGLSRAFGNPHRCASDVSLLTQDGSSWVINDNALQDEIRPPHLAKMPSANDFCIARKLQAVDT